MADLFIIGQFNGVNSTTAVSIGSQVMHMITVMIVGLAMGTTVMVGRAVGAKRLDQAEDTVGNTIVLFMTLSILSAVLLLIGVDQITQWMSTPPAAVEGTKIYLIICFIGIPFVTAYNIISSIFRGLGDSKSPMYFIAIACAANIILDYVFIGGFKLGPAGAALGTTLSQTISVIISLMVILKRKQVISLSRKNFKVQIRILSGLLKIGVPVALQDGFIQVAFIVITIIANRRGLNDAAAVGIVEKIIGILFLVPSSMLSSVSALASQNIGAGLHQRARLVLRYAILLSVGWGILAVIIMQLFPEQFVGLFVDQNSPGGKEVVRLGAQYMRGYVWDCILAGIHFSFSGFFCAYELSMIPFIHNVISILFARIPLSYLASIYYPDTLFPMGLASPLGSLVSVVICLGVYLWMRKRLPSQDFQKSQE